MRRLLHRRSPAENAFVEHALSVCRRENVKVLLRPVKTMKPIKMTGYFDWDTRTIEIARRSRHWFQIFVHEFCHLEQALEGMWISARESNCWKAWEGWLLGERGLPLERLRECTRIIQACELDAEQRVVRHAARFPSIDLERYRKGANLYVLAYEAARLTRRWYNRSIFRSQPMMSLVPGDRFIDDPEKLPQGFLDRYILMCGRAA